MAKILVVDDSPTLRHRIGGWLANIGHEVLLAENGQQGVEIAQNCQPDLIFMDIVMPQMNGFEATRILHQTKQTADIPVVILSNKALKADKQWGLRQGATDYLIKPSEADEIHSTVQKWLPQTVH